MRTKVTETTVYTWDELSDSAKDTARQEWSQFLWDSGSMQEEVQETFEYEAGERLGWEDLGDLTYSLYSPGGEPTWKGTLRGWEFEGRTYTVTSETERWGYAVVVEDEDDEREDPPLEAGYPAYQGPAWLEREDEHERARRAARDMVASLSSDLLQRFREVDDYRTTDESMAEACEANCYEFTGEGHLA